MSAILAEGMRKMTSK